MTPSPPPQSQLLSRMPACDFCRDKKIRCGREKPICQNCLAASASCVYSDRPKKRDNEASRVARQFDEVNERLGRIEDAVGRLVDVLEGAGRGGLLSGGERTASATWRAGWAPPRREEQYLGASSLMSLSSEAGSLAEEQLRRGSPMEAGARRAGPRGGPAGLGSVEELLLLSKPERTEAVGGALKDLSSISTNVASWFPHYGHAELRMGAGGASMEVPPREVAEDLVDEYFRTIHVWFPIFEQIQFRADVARFYAGDAKLAEDRAWLVCFNNVMLFGVYNKSTSRKEIDLGMGKNFFLNGWAAIDDLEVFMAPRLRNVQALLTGAVIAIEISRPGLCWSLMSGAARLSQAIGLHRRQVGPSNFSKLELEERKCVFWNVYIFDKCLSLTFGRSTCLPDFDCDADLPEDDGKDQNFKSFLALIELAKIQSGIYIRLYSASAARQGSAEKEKAILDLDLELRAWWAQSRAIFDPVEIEGGGGQAAGGPCPLGIYCKLELRFSFLCSLTLVHRMATPNMATWEQSESQCLESARDSIRVINEVVDGNLDVANSGMIIWLFQYYPFTSFFVLFSAIIRSPTAPTSTSVDFELMQSLVSYLSRMQAKYQGAAKLLQVASAFTHVASEFLKNYGKPREERTSTKRQRQEEEEGEEEERGGFFVAQQHDVPEQEVEVDLLPAAFLRWPQDQMMTQSPSSSPSPLPPLDGAATAAAFDIDLQAMMDRPEGLQAQMEMAALRGPLEFDWFGWDGQFDGNVSFPFS